jgi:hypothetical protein
MSGSPPTFVTHVEPPPPAVPADHRLRPNERKVVAPPAWPQVMEPDPEDAIGVAEARTGMGPEDDLKLVTKGEVLEGEVTVRSPKGEQGAEGD